MKLLSIIVPVYNEEDSLRKFYESLINSLKKLDYDYEIIFVNDGGTDESLNIMKELRKRSDKIKMIAFSRNFGHEIALTAGIDRSCGDAVIMMDADLQHPPEVIRELIRKWEEGYEVVYTIRRTKDAMNWFRKVTSSFFHILFLLIAKMDLTAGDFRLIDRCVVEQIKLMREKARFVRGLVHWAGFNRIGVEYVVSQRYAGTSKYSIRMLVKLAVDSITSFSQVPLRIAVYFGFLTSFIGFIYAAYAIYIKLFTDRAVHGWASILITVTFIGGVQLICLGIVGEYLGRIFEEVKNRPIYIVKESIGFGDVSKESNMFQLIGNHYK